MTREEIFKGIEDLGWSVAKNQKRFVLITKTWTIWNGLIGTAYHEIDPEGVKEDCSTCVLSVWEPEIRKYTRALHKLMKDELEYDIGLDELGVYIGRGRR